MGWTTNILNHVKLKNYSETSYLEYTGHSQKQREITGYAIFLDCNMHVQGVEKENVILR